MADQITKTDKEPVVFSGWRGELILWLRNQAISTIFAVVLLGVMIWVGYHILTEIVPSHLKSIHEGYRALATDYQEDLKTQRTNFESTVNRLVTSYDKSLQEQRATNTLLQELLRESRNR